MKKDLVVEFIAPSFERGRMDPVPSSRPATPEEWEALRTMTVIALSEMGLRRWNDPNDPDEGDYHWRFPGRTLMLFPAEWRPYIPEGFEVVTIAGRIEKFSFEGSDDDMRVGCLAYGVLAAEDPS